MTTELKERHLNELGTCPVCKKGLNGDLTFYRVKIERFGLKIDALQRRMALQTMLGGSGALARAMGPDEGLAVLFDGPHDVFVHENCAHSLRSILQLVPEEAEG